MILVSFDEFSAKLPLFLAWRGTEEVLKAKKNKVVIRWGYTIITFIRESYLKVPGALSSSPLCLGEGLGDSCPCSS